MPHKRKSCVATPHALTPADISQRDAIWFSRLPEKVKRGQFTVEEQILLTGRHETQGQPDAADQTFYNLGGARGERGANRSLPSLESTHSSDTEEHPSDRDSPVTDTDDEMDAKLLESFHWIDNNDSLDLSLDDYHIHLTATAERAKIPSHRRPSYRRSRSAAGLAFGLDSPTSPHRPHQSARSPIELWGSSWGPSPNPPHAHPPLPPIPSANYSRPAPTLEPAVPKGSAERKASRASPSPIAAVSKNTTPPAPKSAPLHQQRQSLDINAKHYLDPEARLKLRLYLATPSKFDEALEFGFPAVSCATQPTSAVKPPNARRPSMPASMQPTTQVQPPTPELPSQPAELPRTSPARPSHQRSRPFGSATRYFSGSTSTTGLRTFLDDATASTVSAPRSVIPNDLPPRLDLSPSPPPPSGWQWPSGARHRAERSVSSISSVASGAVATLLPPYYHSAAMPSVSSLGPSTVDVTRPAPAAPINPAASRPDADLPAAAASTLNGRAVLLDATSPSDEDNDLPSGSPVTEHGLDPQVAPRPCPIPSALETEAPREMTLRMTLTRPDLREVDDGGEEAPLYVGRGAKRSGSGAGLPEAGTSLLKRGPSFKEHAGGLKRFWTRKW